MFVEWGKNDIAMDWIIDGKIPFCDIFVLDTLLSNVFTAIWLSLTLIELRGESGYH